MNKPISNHLIIKYKLYHTSIHQIINERNEHRLHYN
uniref:Uncharacterized protein n=1 Tax=Rhizophora mucronata TaxID=61149 RepID=A0A2P2IPL2_RHIMU